MEYSNTMHMVLVTWVDSAIMPAGWIPLADAPWEVSKHQSVGFLYADTDEKVTLIPHINAGSESITQICYGIINIPKCSIISIEKLQKTEAVDA